jgi:hypothetical protein
MQQMHIAIIKFFFHQLQEDYDAAFEIMDSYYLDKDLVDAIAELEYPLKGQKTLQSQLTTSIKTAFTKK